MYTPGLNSEGHILTTEGFLCGELGGDKYPWLNSGHILTSEVFLCGEWGGDKKEKKRVGDKFVLLIYFYAAWKFCWYLYSMQLASSQFQPLYCGFCFLQLGWQFHLFHISDVQHFFCAHKLHGNGWDSLKWTSLCSFGLSKSIANRRWTGLLWVRPCGFVNIRRNTFLPLQRQVSSFRLVYETKYTRYRTKNCFHIPK